MSRGITRVTAVFQGVVQVVLLSRGITRVAAVFQGVVQVVLLSSNNIAYCGSRRTARSSMLGLLLVGLGIRWIRCCLES